MYVYFSVSMHQALRKAMQNSFFCQNGPEQVGNKAGMKTQEAYSNTERWKKKTTLYQLCVHLVQLA